MNTKIRAVKKIVIYADVIVDGIEYRVWPNGTVDQWVWYTDDEGGWQDYPDYEDDFLEIQTAGLAVIHPQRTPL